MANTAAVSVYGPINTVEPVIQSASGEPVERNRNANSVYEFGGGHVVVIDNQVDKSTDLIFMAFPTSNSIARKMYDLLVAALPYEIELVDQDSMEIVARRPATAGSRS